jgi:type VI secretion system (T6SS) effector TldE1-like protein
MAFDAAIAEGLLSRRRVGRSETAALVLAALALALGAAAWISDSDQTTALASAALPRGPDPTSFNERFSPLSVSGSPASDLRFSFAKDTLARQLMSPHWRAGFVEQASLDVGRVDELRRDGSKTDDESRPDEGRSSASAGIPLPRARPAIADLESRPGSALALADSAQQSDDRTLLQKLTDLLPGRIKLASLTPEGGLFRQGPDLASLGYDSLTAVYDISAHAVYLPNGVSLEAHSGMGSLRDDPEHVGVRMAGATPPAVYELKPREHLFHGVQALRMTPAEGSSTNGRSGLLTHSYMLGPDGDSNGCVSIRDYDRFLKAFNDGQFNRLVVVPSLSNATMAAQHSNTPS